jgi:hypothetical protein
MEDRLAVHVVSSCEVGVSRDRASLCMVFSRVLAAFAAGPWSSCFSLANDPNQLHIWRNSDEKNTWA